MEGETAVAQAYAREGETVGHEALMMLAADTLHAASLLITSATLTTSSAESCGGERVPSASSNKRTGLILPEEY